MFKENKLMRQVAWHYLEEIAKEIDRISYCEVHDDTLILSFRNVGTISTTWTEDDDYFIDRDRIRTLQETEQTFLLDRVDTDDLISMASAMNHVNGRILRFTQGVERMTRLYDNSISMLMRETPGQYFYYQNGADFLIKDRDGNVLEVDFLDGTSKQRGESPGLDYLNRSFQGLIELLKAEWDISPQ